jgi:hypothetical protein
VGDDCHGLCRCFIDKTGRDMNLRVVDPVKYDSDLANQEIECRDVDPRHRETWNLEGTTRLGAPAVHLNHLRGLW